MRGDGAEYRRPTDARGRQQPGRELAAGWKPACWVGDAVQASTIAPLTGVYQATGAIVNGAGKTPITVTMTLQQGVTSSTGGVFPDQAYALNGSVTVDGTTCFHTGTLRTAVPTVTGLAGVGGAVFGSMAFPVFTMDDGASLIANVHVNDVAASQLSSEGLGVSSGNCASSLTQQIQIGNFVRR